MCGSTIISDEERQKIAAFRAVSGSVTKSPFGTDDQIGMLNLVDATSAAHILAEADPWKVFDLSTDYFIGMPSWTGFGDIPYQIWMSHTPSGSVLDDPAGVGPAQNARVSYSGDCVAMYTHCGTHVDTLSHFGYDGHIWNGFSEKEHLGSRHWTVVGADKHPPIIARGVVLDVAAAHGVEVLPDSYGIRDSDLRDACKRQGTDLRVGDVVIVRTGKMSVWPDTKKFIENEPGIDLSAARYLAESGAITIGADNIALEQLPTEDPDNWQIVHCYLLAEAGIPVMEMVNVDELAAEGLYEFAFLGACLRLRGATGSPMRPFALPLKR